MENLHFPWNLPGGLFYGYIRIIRLQVVNDQDLRLEADYHLLQQPMAPPL